MSSIYLLVRTTDGLCVNAIRWDASEPYEPEDGQTAIPLDESWPKPWPWIGWTLTNDEWVAPPEPEPDAQQ